MRFGKRVPCRTLRAMAHRIGRRGYALIFFGLLDLVYGWALTWPDQLTRSVPQNVYAGSLLPLRVWGAAWLAVGVVCLVQSVMRRDSVAFACAIFIKIAWALLAAVGWQTGNVPRGYLSAVIWLVFAGLVSVVASWPEPPPPWLAHWVRFAPEALVTADSEGRIVSWNSGAVRMFGWRAPEVLGKPLTMIVPQDQRAAHQEGFARAVQDRRSRLAGQVLQMTALRRDGRTFPVELIISVWPAEENEIAISGLVRDMSTTSAPRFPGGGP